MTFGGYTMDKLELRASKRQRSVEEQKARDSRSSAQKLRDRTGRGRIEPPAAKMKDSKPAPSSGKKKR